MSIGEGIAFAALMWAVVQLSYLLHQQSRMITVDEVRDKIDRLSRHLEECIGPMESDVAVKNKPPAVEFSKDSLTESY